MNRYEAALFQFLDQMLAEKNCKVENDLLRHSMVELMRNRFREIAVRTINGANHAGRTAPCYFDLERTFRLMGIRARGLKATKQGLGHSLPPLVQCRKPRTRDEDFLKGPQVMLTTTSPREMANNAHVPDYFPPFPAPHTFRNTLMQQCPDREYVRVRNQQAENQMSLQKTMNAFFLDSMPSVSLFRYPQADQRFNLLQVDRPLKPAFLQALMPCEQLFDEDIYDPKDEITHAALNCAFLREPTLESSRKSINEGDKGDGDGGGGQDEVMQELPNLLDPDPLPVPDSNSEHEGRTKRDVAEGPAPED